MQHRHRPPQYHTSFVGRRPEIARTGHVEDVVRHNVREFEAGAPVPDALS